MLELPLDARLAHEAPLARRLRLVPTQPLHRDLTPDLPIEAEHYGTHASLAENVLLLIARVELRHALEHGSDAHRRVGHLGSVVRRRGITNARHASPVMASMFDVNPRTRQEGGFPAANRIDPAPLGIRPQRGTRKRCRSASGPGRHRKTSWSCCSRVTNESVVSPPSLARWPKRTIWTRPRSPSRRPPSCVTSPKRCHCTCATKRRASSLD